ncbi:MAG: hypothetical protein ISP35_06025 [Ilumatobacteraceae bacterium]|nr:hypothetical protein [Ilumatobacteraceae bacterium]
MSDGIVTLASARAAVTVDLAAGGRLASLTVDGDELSLHGCRLLRECWRRI